MKKLVLPLLLLALLGGQAQAQGKKSTKPAAGKAPVAASATPSLALGSEIPLAGAMLMGVEGAPTNMMQLKTEKGLIVMFSCNTCPFVVKAQPRTKAVMDLAKKLGFGMVIINSNQAQREAEDSRNAMRQYADQQGYTVPYLIDEMSIVADAFGATRTPEVFVFNGEGHLVYKGALEDNPADPAKSTKIYVDEALKALSEGKTITTAETKSIGCSIKRIQS